MVIQIINRTERHGVHVPRCDVLNSLLPASKQDDHQRITDLAAALGDKLNGAAPPAHVRQQITADYLADCDRWRGSFIRNFVVPALAHDLQDGQSLPTDLLNRLQEAPFESLLTAEHVRELVAGLTHRDPLTADQIIEILTLFDLRHPRLTCNMLQRRLAGNANIAARKLLSELLGQFGTAFAVPYLLSRVVRSPDRVPACGSLLALLSWIGPLLRQARDKSQLQQLRLAVAALLTRPISANKSLHNSEIVNHLCRFRDYRRYLGLRSTISADVGQWLLDVAEVIEREGPLQTSELRQLWSAEVQEVLRGARGGLRIIPRLFRVTFDVGIVDEGTASTVRQLLKQARRVCGYTQAELQGLLEQEFHRISHSGNAQRMTRAYCELQKIVQVPPRQYTRNILLAAVTRDYALKHALAPLAVWPAVQSHERQVARVARKLLDWQTDSRVSIELAAEFLWRTLLCGEQHTGLSLQGGLVSHALKLEGASSSIQAEVLALANQKTGPTTEITTECWRRR